MHRLILQCFLFTICYSNIYGQQPVKENLNGLSTLELYNLGVIDKEIYNSSQLPPSVGALVLSVDCDENYIPIDSSYTPVPRNDDGSLYIPDIGFTFNFCESSYSDVYINTNGNLSFTTGVGQFSASGFPFSTPMIAPFWADVDTRNEDCGQAYYKLFGNYMIVTWDSVGWFSNNCSPLNSFQVIITDGLAPIIGNGNNIQFRYLDMEWTTGTASGGGPFGGVPATVGYNSGNNVNYEQIGRFNQNSSEYDGPYGNNDGVHYLDKKCFSFNADLTEEYDINLVCIDTTVFLDADCQYTVDIFHIAEYATNGCYTVDIEIDPPVLTCDDLGMNVLEVTISNAFSTETCSVNVELLSGDCSGIYIEPVPIICESSDPINLIATPSGGDWTGAPFGVFDPGVSGPGIHEIIYTNENACPEKDTIYIEVLPSPQVIVDPEILELCNYENPIDHPIVAIGTGGDGNYSFNWDTPGGAQTGSTVYPESSGVYSVTVTDGNTCFSDATMEVIINPETSVSLVDPGPICNNINYSIQIDADPPGGIFSGSFISQDGIIYPYDLEDTTFNIYYEFINEFDCASLDSLEIVIIGVPEAIATNNSPVCEGNQILLFGNADPNVAGITYIWSGPGSFVSGVQNPTDATEEGYYYLELLFNGCLTDPVLTEVVFTDNPDIEMMGGILGCGGNSIEISATSSMPGSTFSWNGPNGFSSNLSNPSVTDPGLYFVTVTVGNSCSSTDFIEVLLDETPPDISGNGELLNCDTDSIQIASNSSTPGVTYYWSGPNGFSSTQQNPFVYIPGEYQVIVTGTNGCSDSLTVEVIADDIYPVVATYDDTLNCDITDIELSIDVDLTGVTYNWSGPNSFNSIDPTPTVSIPGIYSITVTSDVGCTTIDSLIVHEDTLTMPLITSFGSLSCNETETDIGVSGLPDDVEIFWTGPGGYTSNDSISTVIEAGNYTLEVVFANGCSRIKTVNVDQNIIPPEFTIGGDTIISCSVGFATLQGTSPVSNASFEWKNELGDIVGTGEMISVSAEGNYTLIVVDPANGCADSASIVVLKDQDTPNLEVRGDTINCIGSTFYISADSDANIFNWEGPNGYSSNMAINQISLPGLYSVTVTADNGCIAVETISVVDDTDEPHINLESEILDCNNTEITISLTSTGLGNIFSWDGPDAYFSNEEDPLVGESGIYIVTVTSSNGCSSIDSILISENIYIPNLNTSISNDINCFLPETTITANSDSIISTYQWTGPEGFAWNQASTQISVPGIYYITAVAENGCENIDSVSVLIDTISPEIQLASGYLDCINLQITIDASISNGQNPEYTWTGPGGFTSSLEDPIVTTGGEYFVTVTNDNGCQSVNHIYVGQDVIVPVSEIEVVEFDCDGSDAQLSATLSESNLSYTWSGPGGAIFDGQTISVAEGGTYSLTVTNESNECSYTLNTQLNELNPVSGFSYETIDPGCLYEFGSIMITDIVGGQGDIMFSIDGGNSYQNSNMFTDLSSGQYEVILLDSNECMTSQEILITELFDFDVTIDPDLIINEGEELNLHLELPFDSSLVETIIWSPGDNLSCTDCLEPLFFGNLSTVISVVVYDINGCSGSAQFKITVKEKSVFAPNVFTPNEDGVNDVFTLFGDETIFMSIKELSIFDRWGNRLYIQKNFPLNTNAGWDGKSKGSYVDDGVYVFYAVVEKADGKLVTLCKDVTVLK